MKLKRLKSKLNNELDDFQLGIAGATLYVDIEEILEAVMYVKDLDEKDDIHLNAPKYELIRLLLEIILSENESVDDSLGVRSLKNSTIPFKLALNTLINYNIIKEIKN
tara:strand:+ start:304 stop:627 length:324 start_codon:yes stop_codon:yes gene_type:complete